MERPRTIAYLRAATTEDNFEKSRASVSGFAKEGELGEVEWVEEFASGLASWKERKIAQILEELEPGDRLIVQDLSRLSRSNQQCLEILAATTIKRICVYSVNQPQLLDGSIPPPLLGQLTSVST
ncbi:MAG: recombinase family protein [Anaerolineales bacterium]|nr:recombinase family protein [Anaerolineales bacterium]